MGLIRSDKSGEARLRLAADMIRARIAKYPYLTSEEATPNELLVATNCLSSAGGDCGIVSYFPGTWLGISDGGVAGD